MKKKTNFKVIINCLTKFLKLTSEPESVKSGSSYSLIVGTAAVVLNLGGVTPKLFKNFLI